MSLNTMNSQQQQMQQQGQGQQGQQEQNRDIETIRRNYKAALSELTFNSKPIITNLTIMAQENKPAASVIVREIESQLRNNAPGQKLPVLYLIDSICKNVGGTFITNFGRNMVTVFLDAYTLVDTTVRGKFERLLQTWKNGMPGGNAVFPRHTIESIERSINYIREKTPTSRYPHLPPSSSSSLNKPVHSPSHSHSNTPTNTNNSAIHVNPNFINKDPRRDPRNRSPQTIPQKAQQQQQSPLTSSSNLLSQLQSMVPSAQTNTFSSADPVSQIINQIKALLPTLPPNERASIEQYLAQIASPSLASAPTTIATPSPTLLNPSSLLPPFTTTTTNINHHTAISPMLSQQQLQPQPQQQIISPVLQQQQPAIPKIVDTADLLKSLTSMGYLSPSPPIVNNNKPAENDSTEATLDLNKFEPFLLDSKDLQIARPGAIELLYSAEPLQCKQCGFRYPKTEKGQAKMDAHLDSHFRQNRKMKERVKRGLSRSWFVTVDEWINGEGGELMSQQAPAFLHDGMGQVNNKSSNEKSNQPNEEVINPDLYTVIMPNDDGRKPCAICGERFIDFWNDEEEEWMYKNAIIIDDKIYHATCHADAIKSGSLVEKDTEMQDVNKLDLKRKMDEDIGSPAKQIKRE